jgi:hypothetical protein
MQEHRHRSCTTSKESLHSLKPGINGILGLDGTIKGIVRSAQVTSEPTTGQVTNIAGGVEVLVWVFPSHAFFGRADIHLIILNFHELFVELSNDPGAVADDHTLKAQGKDEEDLGDCIFN